MTEISASGTMKPETPERQGVIINKKKSPLYKSFGYAFYGIYSVIKKERNMKIHCGAAILVIIFGIWLSISKAEWIACLIQIALVMSLEMVNTAVESTVDLVTEEKDPRAKLAKDAAAGAVLTAAIFSFFFGGMIFLPKIAALLV